MLFNNIQAGVRRSSFRTNMIVTGRFRSDVPNFSNVPKNCTEEEASEIHDRNVEEARKRADKAKDALLVVMAEAEEFLKELDL